MKNILFALLLTLIPLATSAMNPPDSTANIFQKGSAAYIMSEGKTLYNEGGYRYALAKFRNALEKNKNNPEAIYWIGECHLALNHYEKAIENVEKALSINPDVFKESSYLLGVSNHRLGNLDKAIENFTKLKSIVSKQRAKELLMDFKIAECERAKEMIKMPLAIDIESLGIYVNSPQDEFSVAYSANRKALYFTSRRSDTKGGGVSDGDSRFFSDIYVCLWDSVNNIWGEPSNDLPINKRINSNGFDGVSQITSDGRTMLLTVNTMGIKPAKPKTNHTDIFISKFSNKGIWSTPKPLPKPINSAFFDAAPCFNGDESVIYFISERPGGEGKSDIYCSKKVGKEWGKPENLKAINTEGQETTVFVTPDESYLFFSSNGHEGMGGYDVYVSKNVNGEWSKPINLGYPINNVSDETHFTYFKDLNKAYYSKSSSLANKGKGMRDIFEIDMESFKWPEK